MRIFELTATSCGRLRLGERRQFCVPSLLICKMPPLFALSVGGCFAFCLLCWRQSKACPQGVGGSTDRELVDGEVQVMRDMATRRALSRRAAARNAVGKGWASARSRISSISLCSQRPRRRAQQPQATPSLSGPRHRTLAAGRRRRQCRGGRGREEERRERERLLKGGDDMWASLTFFNLFDD